jgi:hypothetical protein
MYAGIVGAQVAVERFRVYYIATKMHSRPMQCRTDPSQIQGTNNQDQGTRQPMTKQ